MKNKRLLVLLGWVILAESIAFAGKIVPITAGSCKYDINVPDGWDTIPYDTLKKKLNQYDFDKLTISGIYPISQNDYFKGNYSIVIFMPAANNLNKITFKRIVSDIVQINKSSVIKNDTLQVVLDSVNVAEQNKNLVVNGFFSVKKDSVRLENCQTWYPTKFGYVMVLSYKRAQVGISMNEMQLQLKNLICIADDYKYEEPKSSGISIKHIILSLCIGLFVYGAISYFPKLKKRVK
jgi:hypothetical protein